MQIATTYSIVAHEPSTGRIGAAVQSHWFNVADVLWVRAGIGAVATQSLASFGYGPRILDRLEDGGDPTIVLPELLADDPDRDVRQISVLTPRVGPSIPAHAASSMRATDRVRTTAWPPT